MNTVAVVFRWEDGIMRPATAKQLLLAREQFRDGGCYKLTEYHQPTDRQRKWYFDRIEAAHQHMHEALREKWPTPKILRYWSLSHTDFRQTIEHDISSDAHIRQMVNVLAEQSAWQVLGQRWFRSDPIEERGKSIFRQYYPISQRIGLMDGGTFHQSANASLDNVCRIMNVSLDTLEKMVRHTT